MTDAEKIAAIQSVLDALQSEYVALNEEDDDSSDQTSPEADKRHDKMAVWSAAIDLCNELISEITNQGQVIDPPAAQP